jgi:hypothetical protein
MNTASWYFYCLLHFEPSVDVILYWKVLVSVLSEVTIHLYFENSLKNHYLCKGLKR